MMKTSTSTSSNVYAIGVGRYVELRVSTFKPKLRVSKYTKMAYVRQVDYDDWSGDGYKTVRKKVVYKQASYVGGKVLGYMKDIKFGREFGPYMADGDIVLIPANEAGRLLNPRTRRRLLI